MSPEVVAALLGAAVGAAVTLIGQEVLRRRGELHQEVRAWSGGRDFTDPPRGITTEQRVLEVRFFNGTDVNSSLWDVRAEFYEGEELLVSMTPEPIGPIDLPARQTVFMALLLEAGGERLEKLKRSDRGMLTARVVPKEKPVREPLPAWDPLFPIRGW